jgi:magnesium-protoporphyrin IX monomethyl ester (oxidative) cyclase
VKVLLVNPPYQVLFGRRAHFVSLGLLYIASVLRENGIDVKVYDSNQEKGTNVIREQIEPRKLLVTYRRNLNKHNFYIWKEIRKVISSFSPDVVGIHLSTPAYKSALNVAKIVKEFDKDIIVVVGGPHPTALPEKTVKEPFLILP